MPSNSEGPDTFTLTSGSVTVTVTLDGFVLSRPRYTCTIDYPDGQYISNDLEGGTYSPGDAREGMESFLGFLEAAAEGREFEQRTGLTSENADLFPAHVLDQVAAELDDLCLAVSDELED